MNIFENYEVKIIKKMERNLLLCKSSNKNCRKLGKFLLDRMKRNNGCNIFSTCEMGKNVYIAHPTNITIGSSTIIGNNILIYPGVQLVSNPIDETIITNRRRHPLIQDNCILCVNCIIIGNITIGKNCIVGAGAIVTHDVPDNTIVLNVNEFRQNNYDNNKIVSRMVNRHSNHIMFMDKSKILEK